MCTVRLMDFRIASLQIDGGIDPDGIVHETLRGKGSLGETGVLEILRLDPDGVFKDGVADEKFFPFPPVDDEIVRVELETHLRREIGEPVNRCLQADDFTPVDEVSEFGKGLSLVPNIAWS